MRMSQASKHTDPFLANVHKVSQRGVVFFRNQNIDLRAQKELTQKLGELAGKPETSKLHVQPLYNSPDNTPLNEQGDSDPNGG